ncbi:MAG: H/ACA RNA-protein complex protein Gar1 [Thermococcus sp.]|uniref:H/ACA RNA-protein complex protein Gar1 n=1 Tax=Thermococcus guaymasensis DSM 11113 TaxID=1432656 RepID=A0A0X1KKN8_9EURY|nr:Gar1/Naf1 family protein [Thermococcus guaymasensis]AJC71816.1 H/ACA RNA-protein complex protein Gar1 [Thermococcus guaymasensis DSM 11113]MCD6525130.1 H/ACA RNA-protein complex protein Gar1 [Thermococcus sp.]
MKRLGKVSHYAKQGFLIVRTNWVPSLNDRVVDKDLTFVGIVKDVFGPVKAPFVAVKPRVKKPESYVGSVLYVDNRANNKARRNKKGTQSKKRRPARRPAPKKRG